MVVIRVEMWPKGDQSKAYLLGQASITNNAEGTLTRGNYVAQFFDKAGHLWRGGVVTGFPRKRLLVWDLLYRALKAAVGDRNE